MDADQARSNVSGIQCQDIVDCVSSKSNYSALTIQTKKSDNNKGGFASNSVVNMKQKLLQELASLQVMQKEFEKLTLEITLKESTHLVEKAAKMERLENLKTIVRNFVRDVLRDSEKENQESLVEEVKQAKRTTEKYVFDAKKEIEKIEKKKTTLQVHNKKQKVQKSKKKQ